MKGVSRKGKDIHSENNEVVCDKYGSFYMCRRWDWTRREKSKFEEWIEELRNKAIGNDDELDGGRGKGGRKACLSGHLNECLQPVWESEVRLVPSFVFPPNSCPTKRRSFSPPLNALSISHFSTHFSVSSPLSTLAEKRGRLFVNLKTNSSHDKPRNSAEKRTHNKTSFFYGDTNEWKIKGRSEASYVRLKHKHNLSPIVIYCHLKRLCSIPSRRCQNSKSDMFRTKLVTHFREAYKIVQILCL